MLSPAGRHRPLEPPGAALQPGTVMQSISPGAPQTHVLMLIASAACQICGLAFWRWWTHSESTLAAHWEQKGATQKVLCHGFLFYVSCSGGQGGRRRTDSPSAPTMLMSSGNLGALGVSQSEPHLFVSDWKVSCAARRAHLHALHRRHAARLLQRRPQGAQQARRQELVLASECIQFLSYGWIPQWGRIHLRQLGSADRAVCRGARRQQPVRVVEGEAHLDEEPQPGALAAVVVHADHHGLGRHALHPPACDTRLISPAHLIPDIPRGPGMKQAGIPGLLQ